MFARDLLPTGTLEFDDPQALRVENGTTTPADPWPSGREASFDIVDTIDPLDDGDQQWPPAIDPNPPGDGFGWLPDDTFHPCLMGGDCECGGTCKSGGACGRLDQNAKAQRGLQDQNDTMQNTRSADRWPAGRGDPSSLHPWHGQANPLPYQDYGTPELSTIDPGTLPTTHPAQDALGEAPDAFNTLDFRKRCAPTKRFPAKAVGTYGFGWGSTQQGADAAAIRDCMASLARMAASPAARAYDCKTCMITPPLSIPQLWPMRIEAKCRKILEFVPGPPIIGGGCTVAARRTLELGPFTIYTAVAVGGANKLSQIRVKCECKNPPVIGLG